MVRVAPHVLVYTGAEAWQDIFSHSNGAVAKGEEFGKDPRFYRSRDTPASILGETRDNHSLLRRQLSHGFSEKSLRAQEDIIMGYVDLFVRGLRERCVPGRGSEARTAFDMKNWLNFTTFDVIGDLAFGEPFGCLERGELDPRVAFLDGGLQTAGKAYFVKELGLERFLRFIFSRVMAIRENLIEQMRAVLKRRIDLGQERPDLIEGLLKKQKDWVWWLTLAPVREMVMSVSSCADWSPDRICPSSRFAAMRLCCTSSVLDYCYCPEDRRLTIVHSIIAGSETTATILSGTVFLLLKNPAVLEKLKNEIRSAFKSDEEITFSSVDHLPYRT